MTEWSSISDSSMGDVHEFGVIGGNDIDGENIYVGRVHYNGDHLPGKIVPSHGCIYVPYDGKEVNDQDFQYMIRPNYGRIEWISASDGDVPSGAVIAGECNSSEALFVGRCYHEGSWVIGKVHQSHRCLYIPFGGDEISRSDYEVLTIQY